MDDATKHEELMKFFTPHPDYRKDQYYGVTMMRVKKNMAFSLQLQYGYKKSAENSNSLVIQDLSQALEAYRVLTKFAEDKVDKPIDLSFL